MMDKKLMLYGLGTIVVVGALAILLMNNKSNLSGTSEECLDICGHINSICPSLIEESNCKIKCNVLNQEAKDHIKNSNSCEELTQKPELISELLIPTINTPSTKKATSSCEAACNKYVSNCLTLVPNASESLFQEGHSSCMDECKGWDSQKVECMMTAADCPSMSDVCGL